MENWEWAYTKKYNSYLYVQLDDLSLQYIWKFTLSTVEYFICQCHVHSFINYNLTKIFFLGQNYLANLPYNG